MIGILKIELPGKRKQGRPKRRFMVYNDSKKINLLYLSLGKKVNKSVSPKCHTLPLNTLENLVLNLKNSSFVKSFQSNTQLIYFSRLLCFSLSGGLSK